MLDLDEIRDRLKQGRDRLDSRMNDLGITSDDDIQRFREDEGFADSGSVAAEKGNTISLAETLSESIADIDAALVRLDSGTFGICTECGATIGEARLDIRPAAKCCLDCASNEVHY